MRSNLLILFSDLCLDLWKVILLIVVGDRFARHMVRILPFRKTCIIEFSTTCQNPMEFVLHRRTWSQTVLVRFSHVPCPNSISFLTVSSVRSPTVPREP